MPWSFLGYVDVVPQMWKKNGAGGKEEGEALPPPCPCTASCSPALCMSQVPNPTSHAASSSLMLLFLVKKIPYCFAADLC